MANNEKESAFQSLVSLTIGVSEVAFLWIIADTRDFGYKIQKHYTKHLFF